MDLNLAHFLVFSSTNLKLSSFEEEVPADLSCDLGKEGLLVLFYNYFLLRNNGILMALNSSDTSLIVLSLFSSWICLNLLLMDWKLISKAVF